MNCGKVEAPSSSRSRSPSTARFAATSAILTVTLSRSDRARPSRTVNAAEVGARGAQLSNRRKAGQPLLGSAGKDLNRPPLEALKAGHSNEKPDLRNQHYLGWLLRSHQNTCR